MFNPILSEIIAHEQIKDRLREVEQYRLAKTVIAHQPADSDLRSSIGDRLIAVRYLFKALARRVGAIGNW